MASAGLVAMTQDVHAFAYVGETVHADPFHVFPPVHANWHVFAAGAPAYAAVVEVPDGTEYVVAPP